jgi:multicomponent Na+:H+ antiporter subunit A
MSPELVGLSLLLLSGAALLAPLLAHALGRDAGYPLAALFAAALAVLAVPATAVLDGERVVLSLQWAPGLDVRFILALDGLSLLFAILVLAIGAVVMLYSARYLSPDARHARFYTLLTLFAASMLGLVLAGDVMVLFVFWELTSVTSFLLIGGRGGGEARSAAMRAFLVTGLGGLALFAGLVLMSITAGTGDMSRILADPGVVAGSSLAPLILALVLAGAFTKSAQFPFHFWLPGAMVAPTPVSTYLHAATMVKAGVYLVARMTPLFAYGGPWRTIIVLVGLVTAIVGASLALKQYDLKALLAYSTVSQLGFLMALAGVGTSAALAAMAAHVLAHALYKATLFMVVGIIDREAGSRDIRQLTGLRKAMPLTAAATGLAALSMAGFPPFLGFVSKEEAFAAFLAAPGPGWFAPTAAAMAAASASLTFAYGARIFDGAFEGPLTQELFDPRRSFLLPAALTALTGLALGIGVGWLNPVAGVAAGVATGAPAEVDLALWHGFTPALALATAMVTLGFVLFRFRQRVDRALEPVHLPASGARLFDRVYDATLAAGRASAAPFTSGVPAAHLGWVLASLTAAGVAAWLVWSPQTPAPLTGGETGADQVVAALLVLGAAGAALARSRTGAVAVLGIVGFLVAVVYVLLGGPDLAITQLLVETLTVALVVLVFRRLPQAFRAVGRVRRSGAAAAAVMVGAVAALGTYALTGRREISEAGAYFLRAGPDEAGGRNVVNTILVDFRALDTLGEITVLAVAAVGVMALAAAVRRDDGAPDPSLMLREAARVLTPGMILLAVYFLLRGHDAPGGGFIAALIAGATLVLQYLSGGVRRVRSLLPVPPASLLGAGLLLAVGYGAAGLLAGGEFLQGAIWEVELGPASAKLAASLAFDVGVFLVVLGAFAAYLHAFGSEDG